MSVHAHRTYLLFCVLLFAFCAKAQDDVVERWNVTLGFGLPEMINAGIHYQDGQDQVGGSIGWLPTGADELVFIAAIDWRHHFAGQAKWSDRRPWYFRLGFLYLHDENRYRVNHIVYNNVRGGREFNFSKHLGMAFDIGVLIERYNQEIEKEPGPGSFFSFPSDFLPTAGFTFYYRLLREK
jgi:hypothetical protein